AQPGESNRESKQKTGDRDPEDEDPVETVTPAGEKAVLKAQRGPPDRDDDYVPVDPFDPELFNRRYLSP
ncbi:MAG TPA: hypothetical protein VG125_05740, partial [Pirellulales bacterium]|nr:hypothetical protein [Pirellulales bacterium]